MKNLLTTLGVVVAIAVVAAFVAYRMSGEPVVHEALAKRDALTWLKTDFHLNEEQFATIKKLHESYSVVCEEHCRAIQEALRARNTLKADPNAEPPALAAAEARVQELRKVCETAIAAHVREVASHMSSAEGQRYLALVLPKVADFDHRAPPDVGLSNHKSH